MGKAIGGLPEAAPLAAPAEAEESFALGSWLTRQRELRGISREELSALTRLPMRSLERLEWAPRRRRTLVRGFVRTGGGVDRLAPENAVGGVSEPAAVRASAGSTRVAVGAASWSRCARVLAALSGGSGAARPGESTEHARSPADPVPRSPSSTACDAEPRRTMHQALPFEPAPATDVELRPKSRRPAPAQPASE